MKKRNVRTRKLYTNDKGVRKTKFVVEVKTRGHWRLAWSTKNQEGDNKPLIFDTEYDACAMLLSAFEKGAIPV